MNGELRARKGREDEFFLAPSFARESHLPWLTSKKEIIFLLPQWAKVLPAEYYRGF